MCKSRCYAVILTLLVALAALISAQAFAADKLTDTMSKDLYARCGLNKLTEQELLALNQWVMQVQMATYNNTGVAATFKNAEPAADQNSASQITLYDVRAYPCAYIDEADGRTIYSWTGIPYGYMWDDNIYGFNGRHLGWLVDGVIYDHAGTVVGGTKDALTNPQPATALKGKKLVKPLKAITDLKPLKPIFGRVWSDMPLNMLLQQGLDGLVMKKGERTSQPADKPEDKSAGSKK